MVALSMRCLKVINATDEKSTSYLMIQHSHLWTHFLSGSSSPPAEALQTAVWS